MARAPGDMTVFEQMQKLSPESKLDLETMFLNIQLQNILTDITIERNFGPEGVPVARPHPKLGYVTEDAFEV